MRERPGETRWCAGPLAAVALLVAVLAGAPGRGAAEDGPAPRRAVLILFQDPPEVPLTLAVGEAVRLALRERAGLSIYSEHLDLSRVTDPGYQARLREWIRSKYQGVELGAVVAVAPGAVAFAMRPEPLWPGVPLVSCAVDEAQAGQLADLAGVTGVVQVTPIRKTIQLALQLLPGARRIVLIGGAAETDRAWEPAIRRAAEGLPGDPEVVELFGLPMEELRARLAAIPRGTPVFGVSFLRDGAGRPWNGPEVIRAIDQVAPGPLFVIVNHLVGLGVAGGDVVDFAAVGAEAGRTALRLLDGEAAGSIPIRRLEVHRVVLDWRVLERWGIPDSRIPAGAEVRHRQLPLFAAFPRTTAAVTAALVLQGLLLAAFLLERSRRRRAEADARQRLAEVAHQDRLTAAGELAAALAHEINTPLASIQNSARAVRRFLTRGGAPLDEEVRVGLALVEGEGRRAAEVIRRLRAMLRREPGAAEPIEPGSLLREAAALAGPQANRRGVELRTDAAPGLPQVQGDPVQLLQVILNLAVNGVEAVAQQPPERRLVTLSAFPREGGVRLTVADEGEGFSPEARARLFEPFVTTRREGLGVGLSISRSIVEHHGGRLWLDDAPGGARLHVDLPARAAAPAGGTP